MFSNQETTLRLIEAKFNKQEIEFIVGLLYNKGEGGLRWKQNVGLFKFFIFLNYKKKQI